MIIPEDLESIQRQLGITDVPHEVEAEYERWLRQYHRDGGSGPLGPLAIVALTRFMKCEPPPLKDITTEVDWRKVELGSRVTVSMRDESGSLVDRDAIYRGPVDAGTLAVLVNGESYVREINKRFCRPFRPAAPQDVKIPEVMIRDLPRFEEVPVETADVEQDVDWKCVSVGSRVMVAKGHDYVEGSFQSLKRGKLMVLIDNKEEALSPELVVPVRI